MLRVACALAVLATLAGCGGQAHVAVTVSPRDSLATQPVSIRVTGLKAHEQVTLALHAVDARGQRFSSSDVFRANADGVVDTAHAAPRSGGSYYGVWQMGPVTSAVAKPPAAFFWQDTKPYTFTLRATAGGRTLARTTFMRRLSSTRLLHTELSVAADGLIGTYVRPAGASHEPALLEFGGSEGGPGDSFLAAAFAASGIPTLTLGYFHAKGVPADLHDIPLEYFERALHWLDRQKAVDPRRVTALGISRGSEAVLLLGVHYPSLVHGVIAAVPSSVVNCGIHVGGVGGCIGPAWTIDGKPVPYTTEFGSAQPDDDPRAVIPVERIKAPIMLVCAESDDIWPSCPYSHAILKRLRARHGTRDVKLYAYPGAGHYVGVLLPYEPDLFAYDEQTEKAREALWPHVVAFVKGA
jgi:dienelactone hydrolase